MKHAALPALSALLLGAPALAQQPVHPYDAAVEALKKRNAAEQAAPATSDRKVWDYVIADKKAGTVTVLAFASTIKPTDPVEFFVCTTNSGKDYESLAVTPAKPSDIKAAMEFIGLKPGLPVDFEKNRYWPRGQRVTLSFNLNGKPTRAEDLVIDTNAKTPLTRSGLVFTGSYSRTDEAGKTTLAADVLDAKPIAPLYNDPAAVLDVPRQAAQSVVYGFQKPSPAFTAKAGETVDLVIRGTSQFATLSRPADPEAVTEWQARVSLFTITSNQVWYAVEAAPILLPELPQTRNTKTAVNGLPDVVNRLAELTDGGRDLFTTVDVDPVVSVVELRKAYAVLQAIEKDRGVKLDPPENGELFYRAFFPKPEWRDRATRLGEPWELFLTRHAAGKLTAKLERAVDNPDRADGTPKYVVESTTPADPAAFVQTVNDKANRWSKAIFVYPPADLTYGELMEWVRPVLVTYPRVFVFPAENGGEKPATRPATMRTLDPK